MLFAEVDWNEGEQIDGDKSYVISSYGPAYINIQEHLHDDTPVNKIELLKECFKAIIKQGVDGLSQFSSSDHPDIIKY